MNTPETTEQPTPAVASGVLLACPFCGHLPRLKSGKVKCVNNQCKVQPKTAAWYAKGYEQNAVDDWNTRRQANDQAEASGARGRPIANPDAPAALPPARG